MFSFHRVETKVKRNVNLMEKRLLEWLGVILLLLVQHQGIFFCTVLTGQNWYIS